MATAISTGNRSGNLPRYSPVGLLVASLVVTGLLFLAAMFLSPLIHLVPFEAVAPALVVVGFMMCQHVVQIDWKDPGAAFPAFLTFILMPFTYSIVNGIGAGVRLTRVIGGPLSEPAR